MNGEKEKPGQPAEAGGAGPGGPRYSEHGRHWMLDPDVTFLNHGSFGACSRAVMEAQREWRDRMEADPVRFFKRDLEGLLDQARRELAAFLGADPEALAFVPNATAGTNAVLRSLRFEADDEVLMTTHAYNACRNALAFAAQAARARVVEVPVPFPVDTPASIVQAVLDAVTARTRLAVIDHVTSPTGLRFPVERLVRELDRAGIDTLVDGAHAVGMLDLDLAGLGAAYYVGTCHKWLCAPKGTAFLCVSARRRTEIRPLAISHGASSPRTDRSRFHLEFDWTGTWDPSACLAVPAALRWLGSVLPGGWEAIRARNRALVLDARRLICRELGIDPPCPEDLTGSLAAIPLPRRAPAPAGPAWASDPLQELLYHRYKIEVPVHPWPWGLPSSQPRAPQRLLRLSAHLYNDPSQYEYLAGALRDLCAS